MGDDTLWSAWDTATRIVTWTLSGNETTLYEAIANLALWLS